MITIENLAQVAKFMETSIPGTKVTGIFRRTKVDVIRADVGDLGFLSVYLRQPNGKIRIDVRRKYNDWESHEYKQPSDAIEFARRYFLTNINSNNEKS